MSRPDDDARLRTGRITIRVDRDWFELSREEAVALADQLWRGSRPGAVTAAARLSDALVTRSRAGTVAFEASELEAVRSALAAIGVA